MLADLDKANSEEERFDYSAFSDEDRAELENDPVVRMTLRIRQLDLYNIPEQNTGSKTAAFFDIDGTLIKGSIAGHLFSQACDEGRASRFTYLIFFFFFVLYKLNLIPRLKMYRWGFGISGGITVTEAADFVRRCIRERIARQVYLGARDFVDLHKQLGHRVVAVTGAPDYAAAHVAIALGFDDVLATPTPLDGASISTNIQEPLCYAEGKVPYVKAYAAKHDIDLAQSYGYSDSRSDLPMLELIGKPFCVNPQLLLRLAAWRRKWDILLLRKLGEL